jgi:phospholipase/carboxylesterase
VAEGDSAPLRLVLALHGAGGDATGGLAPLLPFADAHRLLLVAPSSLDKTWDVISRGIWGSDVERINQALIQVFADYAVDPTHLAISGFSDGASYALSLGLANGDLGDAVLAFSPGFAAPPAVHGRPRIWISHGTGDRVLPVDVCGRRVARALAEEGYAVTYEEFDGGHVVPPDLARRAFAWWVEDDGRWSADPDQHPAERPPVVEFPDRRGGVVQGEHRPDRRVDGA